MSEATAHAEATAEAAIVQPVTQAEETTAGVAKETTEDRSAKKKFKAPPAQPALPKSARAKKPIIAKNRAVFVMSWKNSVFPENNPSDIRERNLTKIKVASLPLNTVLNVRLRPWCTKWEFRKPLLLLTCAENVGESS